MPRGRSTTSTIRRCPESSPRAYLWRTRRRWRCSNAPVASAENVLATGASGGIGLALVYLTSARGARAVPITTEPKADAVRSAGANYIVTRDLADLPDQVENEVSGGLDVIADVAGGPFLAQSLPLDARLRPVGHLRGHRRARSVIRPASPIPTQHRVARLLDPHGATLHRARRGRSLRNNHPEDRGPTRPDEHPRGAADVLHR